MGAPELFDRNVATGAPVGTLGGTTNTIPRWTGPSTLGDSGLIDNGTAIYTTTRDVGFGIASPSAARFQSVGVDDKWAARLNGSTTVGKSYGVSIDAGTNSGDIALRVRAAGTGSDYLYVRGNGNVGIGTASPLSIAGVGLTVYGPANGAFYLQNSSNNSRVVSNGNDVYIDAGAGGTGGAVVFRRSSSVTESARIDSNGNIYGTSGTTGMTNGFFYIPAAAGAPTGTPTAVSGRVPMYYDTTNNEFYVYNGAWKKVALA